MAQTQTTSSAKEIAICFVRFVDRKKGKIGWTGFTEPVNYDELDRRMLAELARSAGFQVGDLRVSGGDDSCLMPDLLKQPNITYRCPFEFNPAPGENDAQQHVLASLLLSSVLSTIIAHLPGETPDAIAADLADTMTSLAGINN